jgi:hypothetical protein
VNSEGCVLPYQDSVGALLAAPALALTQPRQPAATRFSWRRARLVNSEGIHPKGIHPERIREGPSFLTFSTGHLECVLPYQDSVGALLAASALALPSLDDLPGLGFRGAKPVSRILKEFIPRKFILSAFAKAQLF